MTILTDLNILYERMLEANEVKQWYSMENISFELLIDKNGEPIHLTDQRISNGNSFNPRRMFVPAPKEERSRNVKSNFLWDNTVYVFGLDKDKSTRKKDNIFKRHEDFKKNHAELLAETTDAGLLALRRFVGTWQPEHFKEMMFPCSALGTNIVFRLDGDIDEHGSYRYIHQRPTAVKLAGKVFTSNEPSSSDDTQCLITGECGQPKARLHRSIKRVTGAQPSGAPLVSFNKAAYDSFDSEQGDNAPISEQAAFAYGTALNTLLAHGSGRNLQIGDATVVFWAKASDQALARSTEEMISDVLPPEDNMTMQKRKAGRREQLFAALPLEDNAALDQTAQESHWLLSRTPQAEDDAAAHNKLRTKLEAIAKGRATDGLKFDSDTEIYILGLAPNEGRLSVRFWQPGSFSDFARHITRFWKELNLQPSPWKGNPSAWSLLRETAQKYQEKEKKGGKGNKGEKGNKEEKNWVVKKETIPPRLGGDLMRAVLAGAPYPRTLLSGVIGRIRADHDINGPRAAICRAFIKRNTKQEQEQEKIPMSLDPNNL